MRRLRKYLIPFFGDKGTLQGHFGPDPGIPHPSHREVKGKLGKPPARNTMHQEMVALRQALKPRCATAIWRTCPTCHSPTAATAKSPTGLGFPRKNTSSSTRRRRPRGKSQEGEISKTIRGIHDYVLFMVNTGLRPDEAKRLEYRDVNVVNDRDNGQTILEIEVRGKRGVGLLQEHAGSRSPFRRLKKRRKPSQPTSSSPNHSMSCSTTFLMSRAQGRPRGATPHSYSLRHTYICLRLMEGADVYQVAKNCRTSVKMIEKFYASHIKNMVDASVINVRLPRPKAARTQRTRQRTSPTGKTINPAKSNA